MSSIRPKACEKLCFKILMGLQYEQPKQKSKRSTLTFGTYL